MRTGWTWRVVWLLAASGGGLSAATLPAKEQGDVASLLRAGKEFYAQGKLREALPKFEEVMKLEPDDLTAAHHIARIRARLGDFKQAIDLVRKLQQRGVSIIKSQDSRETLDIAVNGIQRLPDLRQRADLLVHLRETILGLPAGDEQRIDAQLMAIYAKAGENNLFDVVRGRYFASKPVAPAALYVLARTYLDYDVNLSEAASHLEQAIDGLKQDKGRPSGNPEADARMRKFADTQICNAEDFLAFTYMATKLLTPDRNRFVAAEPDTKIKYTDVTEAVGLKGVRGVRVAVGDFDNDGFEDLSIGGRIFRNNDGKGFAEVTERARVDLRGVVGSLWLDYDNDGLLDLLVLAYPKLRLYHNLGRGIFEDVTREAGLDIVLPGLPEACAAVDYDGDGFVDFFVACGDPPDRLVAGQPCFLFHNTGRGGFQDASETSGLRGKEAFIARGCAWGDFNDDGKPDLYVANGRYCPLPDAPRLGLQPNQLWVNQGGGKFVDTAEKLGVRGTHGEGRVAECYAESVGCAWADFNNDGALDLLVTRLNPLQTALFADSTALYANGGKGAGFPFTNVTTEAGIRFEEMTIGGSFCDVDNDGLLDLYLTCIYKERPTFLYRNEGGNKFKTVTWKAGALAFNCAGQAWFDLDNDGNMDLALGSLAGVRLLKNETNGGSWLRVQLVGKRSNRFGIGSRIRATAGPRTQMREVTAGFGAAFQSSPIAHFGFGDYKGAVGFTIRWPDDHVQTVTVDKLNQLIKVEEK